MGKNIFISYKYKDTYVRTLNNNISNPTIVRNYVDILQEKLRDRGNINLGEKDGEDLSNFKDSTIESKLRDKIFHSSLTIVLISKGMKDNNISEEEQWIPWEISYSLKEIKREDNISRTNALLGIVLPDNNNSYQYFIRDNNCVSSCSCRTLKTDILFKILQKNMFNKKEKDFYKKECNTFKGNPSYIYTVKWDDFINNMDKHINIAYEINNNISNYNIVKEVN